MCEINGLKQRLKNASELSELQAHDLDTAKQVSFAGEYNSIQQLPSEIQQSYRVTYLRWFQENSKLLTMLRAARQDQNSKLQAVETELASVQTQVMSINMLIKRC